MYPGRPVAYRRVHSEVTLIASVLFIAAHGLAYSRQTFRHLADLPIIENEDGITVLLYGSEFHERLVVAGRVETDGHVCGPVIVDKKK